MHGIRNERGVWLASHGLLQGAALDTPRCLSGLGVLAFLTIWSLSARSLSGFLVRWCLDPLELCMYIYIYIYLVSIKTL